MIPNKILVATDGSPAARGAESFAAGLANMMGICQVTVATVLTPRGSYTTGDGFTNTAFIDSSDTEAQAAELIVSEAAVRIHDAMSNDLATVKTVVVQASSTALGLVEQAHADGTCSLIVMGSRGHGGFANLVMGSVSTQVLHAAHCPVLIVKE
jgi:nucleotide-binding universal stress UspA family protein